MGVKKCDIFYDNNSAIYYPSQTINGKVEFTFDSPKKVRGIIIEFKGQANTFWQENKKRKGPNGNEEEYIVHYNGSEEYFNIRYNLFGAASSGQQELPTGHHSFPFTCALPPGLPNSFEGDHGYVRYTIRVILDRPWKFDQEYNFEFKVVSILDLNLKPELKTPQIREVSETFCCCCCESGPFNMTITIPCSGFAPQQKLPVTVECDNASSTKIKHLAIRLERVDTFHVHNPNNASKSRGTELSSFYTDCIEAGENAKFETSLTIPADCPPSYLDNCGIIDIKYLLDIKAKVGGCSESPYSVICVVIGHIPIEEKISELGGGQWEDNKQINSSTQPGPNMNPIMPPPGGVIGWTPDQNTISSPTFNYPPPQNNQMNPSFNYPPAQSTYPPSNSSYPPPSGSPYPPPSNSPYPSSNPSYPPAMNPSYPPASNPAYPPATNPSYLPATNPYPPTSGYPPSNPPYSSTNPAYPPSNSPYPAPPNSGYPSNLPPTHAQYPSSIPPPNFADASGHNFPAPTPYPAYSPSAPPPQ